MEAPKGEENTKNHIKTTSQDLIKSPKGSNVYLTKLINQNKNQIKNQNLINDSLPNLKTNIQNIFANDEKKEKAFRYLIQKNKDRSANISKDLKKELRTPEIKPYKRIQLQTKIIESPYTNKNYYMFKPIITTSYDTTKSCIDLRKNDKNNKKDLKNIKYKYSITTQNYNTYVDDPISHYNNTSTNLLTNNNFSVNRNKGNNYEHISIYNTYNNTFNNYKMQKNKVNKSVINQTYDFGKKNSLTNTLSKQNKNILEENPYKDYLKNSNISKIKKKLLEYNKESIIVDTSDHENRDNKKTIESNKKNKNENSLDKKNNNNVRRFKNEYIKVQKNENLNMKKNPNKNNDNFVKNKTNKYYVHKNLNPNMSTKNNFNPNKIENKIENNNNRNKKNNINVNNKTYEKRKNYYDVYGHKDIHVNTSENKKKNEDENNNEDNKKQELSSIKVNIDKNLLKDYYNSPLSYRYNKYFSDNKDKIPNKRNNKKTYEKRDTIHRSPLIDSTNNKNDINDTNTINSGNNLNPNKLIFNDEEEIIEYIKKKYNKRNIDEIINKGNNKKEIVVEPKKEKEKKYIGLMTSEEGKKIKQKNDELSTEIKNLKFENKKYKKELNDMKNRFNDLSKEINTIKQGK